MAAEPDRVAVGRVGRPRGVHGAAFVEPWTDDLQARFAPGSVLATDRGPLTVDTSSTAGGKLVVQFVGVETREAVEGLRGTVLLVDAAQRPALEDPDEFYDTDLIGLAARTTAGTALGTVRDVLHAGATAYLVLDVEGAERLVPFVSAIVPRVDLAGGVIVVDAPEGLFDL